jgi:hypothetical protein
MVDIKTEARKHLINVLDSIRGKKGLVVDMELSGPLSLLVEFSLLKEHGVEKIYHLQESLETECSKLIYMIRPSIRNMKIISDHIKIKKGEISIFMVPRKTLLCERILEEEGVYGDVHISEFPLDLIPLEEDVYSLELNSAFTDLYVKKDSSCIHSVAQAIMKLQKSVGVIPKIIAKGDYSKALAEHLLRMRTEIDDSQSAYSSSFDSILILERGIDLVTPLCTQLTYQGLIDEVFGISASIYVILTL